MADETPNGTDEGTTQQTAPAPQSASLTITPELQAYIDAEKQKAHDAGAAAARRAAEGKQKPESPKPQQPQPQQEAQPRPVPVSGMSADEVRSLLAFNRAIGAANLSTEAEHMLEQLLQLERPAPAEIPGWVKAKAALFAKANGDVTSASTQATTNPNNQATAQPGPKTQQVAPAPLSTVPSDAPDNVLSWDQTQLDAYIAKHYPVPSMPWHAKNAAARRVLAQKVHASMSHMNITFGHPPNK